MFSIFYKARIASPRASRHPAIPPRIPRPRPGTPLPSGGLVVNDGKIFRPKTDE